MMKFYVIWLALLLRNFFARGQWLKYKMKLAGYRVFCLLFRFLDYRIIFFFSHICRFLRLTSREVKLRAAVAESTRQCILKDHKEFDYIWLTQRRNLLVQAVTYGQNRRLLNQLALCSARLNEIVEPLQRAGQPVILAPLHMVSDVLATMAGAVVYPGKATVIASRSAEAHYESGQQLGGINLTYCSIHEDNKKIAGELMTSLMEAARNQRNIILFPDITPDFTQFASKNHTDKLPCRMFDRPASLHSGIVRLARTISAEVVFYHLYFDKGLKIRVHSPVSAKKLKEEMPGIVEKSIRNYSTDWMLWHSHSLFFIND